MDNVNLNDRTALLEWCRQCDPNGVYTDADCASEGLAPLSLEQARAYYFDLMEG